VFNEKPEKKECGGGTGLRKRTADRGKGLRKRTEE